MGGMGGMGMQPFQAQPNFAPPSLPPGAPAGMDGGAALPGLYNLTERIKGDGVARKDKACLAVEIDGASAIAAYCDEKGSTVNILVRRISVPLPSSRFRAFAV